MTWRAAVLLGVPESTRVANVIWDTILICATSQEDVDDYRREEGELMYKQEFCCEFVDVETQYFPTALIEAAFADLTVIPLW